MKPIENYNDIKDFSEVSQLPVGIQKCKILKATNYEDQFYLELEFDIIDGDYKGYFADLTASNDDGKWAKKGTYRLWYKSETNVKFFHRGITAIEKTNAGYTWDWDENKLVGKYVIVNYREEEYIKDNEIKVTVSPFELRSSIALKEGRINLNPARKCLSEEQKASLLPHTETPALEVADADLPF